MVDGEETMQRELEPYVEDGLAVVLYDNDSPGLVADRVFEVTVLDQEQLDPPPTISAGWQDHCIAGIGRRNGAFVTVLDLGRLLAGLKLPPMAGLTADRAA